MFDIDHLVADCHAALIEPSPQVRIRELVARAVSQPSEVERALGTPRLGGLFSLHRSPGLTILNVVWAPGMAIYPHDHRMWAVANPLRAFTGALHIYGGDFFGAARSEWTPGSLVERPFDVERVHQVYAEANERWTREQEAAR